MSARGYVALCTVFTLTLSLFAQPLSGQDRGKKPPPDTTGAVIMAIGNGVIVSAIPSVHPNRQANSGPFTAHFVITNTSTIRSMYVWFNCTKTGPAACGNFSQEDAWLPPEAHANVSLTYTTISGAGSATISLVARNDEPNLPPTSTGTVNFNVVGLGKGIPMFGMQRLDNVDRGLCLTTAAGEGAGVSCGDLFTMVGLPAYRTLGRDRSVSLYYNSAAASGLTLVAARFTQPTNIATPDQVRVLLELNGQKDSVAFTMPVQSCNYVGCRDTLQVVLGKNIIWSNSDTSGYYPATLTLRNIYGTALQDSAVTGRILVVNRSASEFGRGWSLLGVEQILTDPNDSERRLWLAGDGSMRVYQRGITVTSGMLTQSGLGSFSAVSSSDGNTGTAGWSTSTASAGAWLRVDLGVARTVTTLALSSAAGTAAAAYDVQYSDNNAAWTTAFVAFRPVGGAWRQVTWSSVGAHRYWRLRLTNTPGVGPAVTEVSFGGPNTYYGAPGDAPDSIVVFTSDTMVNWYRRDLKHGASVTFDALGYHRVTTNRVGHRTIFYPTTVLGQRRLGSIRVPPNDAKSRRYTFHWDPATARLDSITDPGGRGLKLVMSGANLVRVIAPGKLDSTRFAYDARGAMTRRSLTRQRTSTKGDSAITTYTYANGARLTQVAVQADTVGVVFASTTLNPWDEKGLVTPVLVDSVGPASRIDGPIAGTGDAVEVLVDGFGQARRMKDLGAGTVTRIYRDSTQTLPSLVTRVVAPHPVNIGAPGRITRLSWNTRGNLVSQRDSTSHLGEDGLPTQGAGYTYADAGNPDSPTVVTDALGRSVQYVYNESGLTELVIDARLHRSSYEYSAGGLLKRVVDSMVSTWVGTTLELRHLSRQFTYDINGNLERDSLPTGAEHLYVSDSLGRTLDHYSPLRARTKRTYDILNRVTSITQYSGPQSIPGGRNLLAGCDATQISCTDVTQSDPSGFAASFTTSYFHGAGGIDSIKAPLVVLAYRYDGRGMPRRQTHDRLHHQVNWVSPAGLLDSVVGRDGRSVRVYHDWRGRRIGLAYSPVQYGAGTVAGDSLVYEYDLLGRLTRSRKADGMDVRRTFYANGSLRTDISRMNGSDSLTYGYDAAGARTRVVHVRTDQTVDSARYFYDTHPTNGNTGDLDSVVVRWGNVASGFQGPRLFTFQWDALGRRRRVVYPSVVGLTVEYAYDAGGVLRRLLSAHPTEPAGPDIFDFTFVNSSVDAAGQILAHQMSCENGIDLGNPCGSQSSVDLLNRYNRRGWLARQETSTNIESIQYDAGGNIIKRQRDDAYPADSFSVAIGNRVDTIFKGTGRRVKTAYNPSGQLMVERGVWVPGSPLPTSNSYYYDGLGRTSGYQTWVQDVDTIVQTGEVASCRYDAIGRMSQTCPGASPTLGYDGDNVVRAGGWSFVHATGIDDPIIGLQHSPDVATVELFYITDGNGRLIAAAEGNGTARAALSDDGYRGWRSTGAISQGSSFAATRLDSPSAPRLSFFRNRIYDLETGRWTQEDPVGIAGGLNMYQFSGNNPVAYTDPFGLVPTPGGLELRALTNSISSLEGQCPAGQAQVQGQCASFTVGVVPGFVGGPGKAVTGLAKRLVGRGNPTKIGAGGKPQPFDASSGRYLSPSSNPGLTRSPLARFGKGFAEGVVESQSSVDGPEATSPAQAYGQALGKILGTWFGSR